MIRLANINDLPNIMTIINDIKQEMKAEGNPQWHDDYPTEDDFQMDIASNSLYVYDQDKILGFICITKDQDNEYERVPISQNKPSIIIHRLGIAKSYRQLGLASKLLKFAENLALKENINLIKVDTEIHNIKMQRLLKQFGYQELASFNWSDNDGEFLYYELELGDKNV